MISAFDTELEVGGDFRWRCQVGSWTYGSGTQKGLDRRRFRRHRHG